MGETKSDKARCQSGWIWEISAGEQMAHLAPNNTPRPRPAALRKSNEFPEVIGSARSAGRGEHSIELFSPILENRCRLPVDNHVLVISPGEGRGPLKCLIRAQVLSSPHGPDVAPAPLYPFGRNVGRSIQVPGLGPAPRSGGVGEERGWGRGRGQGAGGWGSRGE